MPSIKPITIQKGDSSETFNPVGKVGNTVRYLSAEDVILSEKDMLHIRVRPAEVSNSGHITEIKVILPIPAKVEDGCCPTETAKLPVNHFTLTFNRSQFATDQDTTDMISMAESLLGDVDIKSLIRGSGLY